MALHRQKLKNLERNKLKAKVDVSSVKAKITGWKTVLSKK